ncbi:MAG TPA: tetratricopeptide repeat protein, partial [Gemmataceae bacterium]
MVLVLLGAGALAAVGYWRWDHYRARRAWEEAEQAIARRDLEAAAAHLDRYVTFRPEDPAGWFQAARTARRRGKFADAKRFLAEYEELGGAADAVRLERDLLLVQQGVIGEADVRLRATVGPDHPDVRLVLEALARGYLLTERWADARQACALWRAVEPDAPYAWLWGGWVSEQMVRTEQAAEFYRRALELAPDDRDARVAFARVQLRQRNPAAAAPHFEWVLARDPDDVDALLGLAQCRMEAGRLPEAVPLIERVLAREPASGPAAALRGRAAMEGGDPAAAEQWLRQAVRADPADAEALHLLVLSLRAQGKDAEADPLANRLENLRQDLRRLTELTRMIGPQCADPGPCCEAGVIALRIGRTQQGLNFLRDALRRKGDHRPAHA